MSTYRRLISTIIATYNRPDLVIRTLDSVLGQTYRPLEVVVIDDGSEACTAHAIHAWRSRHEPDIGFVYLRQENQGPATARNKGMETCSGELIHFLDDDDLLCPMALEHLAAALRADDPAIAMSSYRHWEHGMPAGSATPPPELAPHAILAAMIQGAWFVPIHGYLFTRRAIDGIGPWNPALTSQEDDEYLLRAALSCIRFTPAPKAQVYYCQHDGVRRATPGKPGENVIAGLKKRMYADLAIRESAFEVLRDRQCLERHRPAFLRWRNRLRKRYGPICLDNHRESEVLDWLRESDESVMDSDNPPWGQASS